MTTQHPEVDERSQLSARQIKALTASATRKRSDKSFSVVLGDLYTALISIGVAVAMMGGAVVGLERSAGGPGGGGLLRTLAPATPIPVFWVAVMLLLAGTAIAAGLLARLGPISASEDQAVWWLSLPVSRRAFIAPSVWRLSGVLAIVGACGAILASIGAAAVSASGIAVGIIGGALLASLVILGQILGWRRGIVVVADIAAVVLPGVLVVLLSLGQLSDASLTSFALAIPPLWPLLNGPGGNLALALAIVLFVGAVITAVLRVDRLRLRQLRAAGSVSSRVASSVMTFDTREISRVLNPTVSRSRRKSAKFRLVDTPVAALLASEIKLFIRSPRRFGQLIVLACVPPVVAIIQGVLSSVAMVYVAMLISAYFAALTCVESARQAELNPSLDRLLPLPATTVFRVRSVIALVVMTVWMAVVCSVIAGIAGMGWQLVLLGVVSVPGFAAAGLRSAYRTAPNWSGSVVATPAGPIPLSAIASLRRGPDFALIGSLALGVALFLGAVPEVVLVAGLALGALLWMLASRNPIPPKKSWMERMSEEAEKQKQNQ
ncbi:DUF6297 family protein [Saxibacter everestensis]|uniref:DUF6297 family protein n=1 Tax=Saxibacter everestensis TaxID=2909229 RepID=A0ABY8QW64_9MICO|nr:DUF6297 family protein [Brevibacteriaceae bacterium ZFBP1038]